MKTYAQDYLEKYPNCKLNKDPGGFHPALCVFDKSAYKETYVGRACDCNTCTECWNTPTQIKHSNANQSKKPTVFA